MAPVDMAGVDRSLEASHTRITDVLAVASRRLEIAAPTGLTRADLDDLGQLANVWRTLEANVERLAEKALEKAIKREQKRLGPEGQIEPVGGGTARPVGGGTARDEADAPDE
jgi:post-segregation antitoxin (ccd killing protein)